MRKNARKNQQKYVELSLFPEEEKNDNIKKLYLLRKQRKRI